MEETPEADQKGVRKGYAAIKAVDPADGKPKDVFVLLDQIQWVAKRGPGHAKELAYSVRHVLEKPKAIFKGVREEDEKNWLCYVGIPERAYYLEDGNARSPWPNQVFCVFVTDEWVVYNWRWDTCDRSDKGLPEDYESRYGERIL